MHGGVAEGGEEAEDKDTEPGLGGARPPEILMEDLVISATAVKKRQCSLVRVKFKHRTDLPSDGCTPTKFLSALSWHTKKFQKCAFDAVRIGFGNSSVLSLKELGKGRDKIQTLVNFLPPGHAVQKLTCTDSRGTSVPMFGSLREVMKQPTGRYIAIYRYGRCVEGQAERDWHATVVNCDAREIWDSANGRVPFNSSGDASVLETDKTHAHAQQMMEQSSGGVHSVWRLALGIGSLSASSGCTLSSTGSTSLPFGSENAVVDQMCATRPSSDLPLVSCSPAGSRKRKTRRGNTSGRKKNGRKKRVLSATAELDCGPQVRGS